MTNGTASPIGRFRYFPYGAMRDEEWTGAPVTDKLFTGHQREGAAATGVYHYQARLYNTDVGRFPQADTLATAEPAAMNRYSGACPERSRTGPQQSHALQLPADMEGGTTERLRCLHLSAPHHPY